jgi:hypothetical protein
MTVMTTHARFPKSTTACWRNSVGQNIAIMTKVKDITAREYYMNMTSQMGWGHNVLLNQIKTGKLPDAKQIEAGILREIEVDQKVE